MKSVQSVLGAEPGVAPFLMGGLGNQMFMVAAAFVMATELRCPLYVARPLTVYNTHNTSRVDYGGSVFSKFGKHLEVSQDELVAATSDSWVTVEQVTPPHMGFAEWGIPAAPGLLLRSYFQYFPPLRAHEGLLRHLFLDGMQHYITTVRADWAAYNLSKCAFVHVRRGDYLGLQHIFHIQTPEYYRDALSAVAKACSGTQPGEPLTVLVFGDDPEWCKAQMVFADGPEFRFLHVSDMAPSMDEVATLALMSQCTAGAVCANSTFSWWGAFLGAHATRAPVVAPRHWIKTPPVLNLFPEEWMII